MNERSLRSLLAHRRPLLQAWEERLRAAPVNSPLAYPDTLVHLMDRTLEEIFKQLAQATKPSRRAPKMSANFCRCGHNPLVAFFNTASLAFQQILAQCADETAITRDDVDAVNRVLHRIARREILNLCGFCLRRAEASQAGQKPPCQSSSDSQTPTA